MNDRLARQLQFLVEVDKLKTVLRQTVLMDKSRQENSAEHSWHLAVLAVLLKEYAADPQIDLFRVVKMVLVHDMVEIDAGDTFCYDEDANRDKAERERKAADRIFGLLPEDQAETWRVAWEEFEYGDTPEAHYARALDRLQPLLHNYHTEGRAWQKHGVTSRQVIERNHHMEKGAPVLWAYAEELIQDAVQQDILKP